MSELYLRQANIILAQEGALVGERYTDFRLAFRCERDLQGSANIAQIQIYNLSEASQQAFQQEEAQVILSAGYGTNVDDAKQIFIGDITKAIVDKSETDTILTLECGDGAKALQNSFVEKSFSPGTSIATVFKSVAGEFQGISNVGNFVVDSVKTFASGFVASGPVADVLSDLGKSIGLDFSIQDNELQVLKPSQTTFETAVSLNFNNGILRAPKKTTNGAELQTLLNPDLKPGRAVIVETDKLSGNFKITKAVHQGDTRAGSWTTDITLERL